VPAARRVYCGVALAARAQCQHVASVGQASRARGKPIAIRGTAPSVAIERDESFVPVSANRQIPANGAIRIEGGAESATGELE